MGLLIFLSLYCNYQSYVGPNESDFQFDLLIQSVAQCLYLWHHLSKLPNNDVELGIYFKF